MKQFFYKEISFNNYIVVGLIAALFILSPVLFAIPGQPDSETFFKDLLDLQIFAGVLGYKKMEISSPNIKNGSTLHITIPSQTVVSGNKTELEMASLSGIQRLSKSLRAKIILTSTHDELKPIEGDILYEITLTK